MIKISVVLLHDDGKTNLPINDASDAYQHDISDIDLRKDESRSTVVHCMVGNANEASNGDNAVVHSAVVCDESQ